MKKIFVIILFIVIAAGFGILGYKFAGSSEPTIIENTEKVAEKPKAELPEDFPAEFLVDKDAKLITAETVENHVTAILMSKLSPEELQSKFISSVKSKGWKIVTQNKDKSLAQVLATYQKENFSSRTVEFRAFKLPDANTETEIDISYLK